jgi:hypothetical protein
VPERRLTIVTPSEVEVAPSEQGKAKPATPRLKFLTFQYKSQALYPNGHRCPSRNLFSTRYLATKQKERARLLFRRKEDVFSNRFPLEVHFINKA